MTDISSSATIAMSRDEVFTRVANANSSVIYNTAMVIKDLKSPSDNPGALGTTWGWDYNVFGVTLHGTTEVVERVEGEKWVTQTGGDASSQWAYTFEDDGEGTKVTLSISIDDAVISKFAFAGNLFASKSAAQVEEVVNNCKAWLED